MTTLELKVNDVTVPDRTPSARADLDAILVEDLLGWSAYLMNAASSVERELIRDASVLIAAADSDVALIQRGWQLGRAELRNGHTTGDAVALMRRALGMLNEPAAA
jgi:hypothetical protein